MKKEKEVCWETPIIQYHSMHRYKSIHAVFNIVVWKEFILEDSSSTQDEMILLSSLARRGGHLGAT